MFPPQLDARYAGATRMVPVAFLITCAFAVMTLITSVSYREKLLASRQSPPESFQFIHRSSETSVGFYTLFGPLLTIFIAMINLALFGLIRLHPFYALSSAIVVFSGWVLQTGIWGFCYDQAHDQDWCPEFGQESYRGGPGQVRIVCAALVCTALTGETVLAGLAVDQWRRDSKRRVQSSGDIVLDKLRSEQGA